MVRYRKAKEDIDAQYPGEGFKEYRRRILAASAVLAVTMVSAFTGASPEKQEAYRKGFEEWTEAKFEQARQASPEAPFPLPDHKQSELSHIFVPAHLMAYLTCIVKGLNMDWLCRHLACLWVIDAFSWVHNSAHEWFRCPQCGSGYQPWAEGKKDSEGRHIQLVQAQKVFTVDLATTVASVPGDLPEGTYSATGDHPELAEVRTEARKTGGHYKMYLCEWPDTDTTSLLNMFMEISRPAT